MRTENKHFRLDEETLKMYNELKKKFLVESDSDLFAIIVNEVSKAKQENNLNLLLSKIEKLNTKIDNLQKGNSELKKKKRFWFF